MIFSGKNIEICAVEPTDYAKLSKILALPQVADCLFGFPSKTDRMAFEEWIAAAFRKNNEQYFTVKEKSTSETVGLCAYRDIDCRNGSVTLWMAIEPSVHSKEYGVQVLRALGLNAFDNLRMEHLSLLCLEDDDCTKACAKKCGFIKDAILYSRIKRGEKRLNLELYSLLKEEVKS